MHLNHPQTISTSQPGLWKNSLPRNWSPVPKRLGSAAGDIPLKARGQHPPVTGRSWSPHLTLIIIHLAASLDTLYLGAGTKCPPYHQTSN